MKYFLFLICLMVLSSCSRKSDSQLYTEGKEAASQKNFNVAADRFEEIVDRFPTVAYAESSLSQLATIYSNDVKDEQKALHTYRRYYTMFPNSKEAPTMLFLSGFLFNNELHNTDSAKAIYQSFLQQYPNHELAQSAKFELENLGKDPGQALQHNVSASDSSDQKEKKEMKP